MGIIEQRVDLFHHDGVVVVIYSTPYRIRIVTHWCRIKQFIAVPTYYLVLTGTYEYYLLSYVRTYASNIDFVFF